MATSRFIEDCDIKQLIPYDKNPRQNDQAVDAVANSIKEFGFNSPIITDADYKICVGHTRYKAAIKLGLNTVPVRVIPELTGSKFTGYNIADNQTGSIAEWDMPELAELIAQLKEEDFDLDLLGFDDDGLNDILNSIEVGGDGLTDDDAVPDPPDDPITKTGDLWLLGNHRLLCGDATVEADVSRLMDGKKADMVFTDPPYGMNLDADYSKMSGGDRKGKKWNNVIGDDTDFDPSFLMDLFSDVAEQFWWGADYYAERLPNKNLGSFSVWDKTLKANGDAGYNSEFEIVWSKTLHKREIIHKEWFRFFGLQSQDTKERLHPTQKPIEIIITLFSYCKENGIVVDPFLGSGSTMIACEKTGRKCYGMEIDAIYCDVIVKRWEDYTGQKAELLNG